MQEQSFNWRGRGAELLLVCCTLAIFLACAVSPPSLLDDVDSVTAQIARNMLESGDWVTARLNGVVYFEKPPLRFWPIAISYLIFGVHDWAARLPWALAAIALCWLVRSIGIWAFSARAGNWAGIVLATCVGLFLFTRILIPDVALTLTVTLALWALARALDNEEPQPRRWALLLAASIGAGFLLKGLIAFVFPVGAGFVYLLATRQLLQRRTWQRLRPFTGLLVIALITLPWIVLATLRNPPYFDFTLKAEPGKYHGFFWFFYLNEHLFRYLNLRYPRDYNTVPRAAFWLYHLLWLFPWSVYFPALARLSFRPVERAGRWRLLCLCWIGFVLVFFTFSTTQEYYSMPAYPAFALLLGAALEQTDKRMLWGTRVAAALALLGAVGCFVLLWLVRGRATTGDIADALEYQVSTLSLGRTQELTLAAFAYLRVPLAAAGSALLLGGLGALLGKGRRAYAALALMMVLFFHTARLALVTFSSYLGSRPLAEALQAAPPGQLIVDDQYYTFSSIFFYTNRPALLLNGRVMNLEYGSHAPGAPDVFIGDQQLAARWPRSERQYLAAHVSALPRLKKLLGDQALHVVRTAGGKYLFTNQPLPASRTLAELEADALNQSNP
jgi:4-amino-4-deoxy-L-arabinose transferase-like glycosyltransferase